MPNERRLPSPVRARDRDELAFADLEIDVLETSLPLPVRERDTARARPLATFQSLSQRGEVRRA